ncbi:MAG: hypothetical protein WC201_01370 [Bacilli bacterium]
MKKLKAMFYPKKTSRTLFLSFFIFLITAFSLTAVNGFIYSKESANYAALSANTIYEYYRGDEKPISTSWETFKSDKQSEYENIIGKEIYKTSLSPSFGLWFKFGSQSIYNWENIILTDDIETLFSHEFFEKFLIVEQNEDENGLYVSDAFINKNNLVLGDPIYFYKDSHTLFYSSTIKGVFHSYYENEDDIFFADLNLYQEMDGDSLLGESHPGFALFYFFNDKITAMDVTKVINLKGYEIYSKDYLFNKNYSSYKPILQLADLYLIISCLAIGVADVYLIFDKVKFNRDLMRISHYFYDKKSSIVLKESIRNFILYFLALLISVTVLYIGKWAIYYYTGIWIIFSFLSLALALLMMLISLGATAVITFIALQDNQ